MAGWLNRYILASQSSQAAPSRRAPREGLAPALRWVVLTGLTYALLLLALVTLRGQAVALAIPLAVYWLAALASVPAKPRLSAVRRLSADRKSVV